MFLFLVIILVTGLIIVIEHYKYQSEYYREQSDLWELKFEMLSDRIKEI